MQGSLGIGADLNKWTPEDFAKAKMLTAQYKTIREMVQREPLCHLMSPENDSPHSVTDTISRDEKQVVTFAFLHSSKELYPYPRIRLRGLDPDARYSISSIAGTLAPETPNIASGAYWMQRGVALH